jgi:hypothetical protein
MLKLLTMEQKQLHMVVSQDMLEYANSDPEFLNIITTGDEFMGTTWKPRHSHSGNIQRPRGQKMSGRFGAMS